jgi:PAS domain S-box-containing protein
MFAQGLYVTMIDAFRYLGHPHAWPMLLGGIYLVERRGKNRPLNPKRQVDITTLLESIPEAALIVDSDRRIIDANSSAAQMLGRSREQLLEASWNDLGDMMQVIDDGGHSTSELDRALAGTAVRSERRLVRSQDNRDLELLVSATPMCDEHGSIVAALVMAQDITELTLLQRRIGDVERHLAIGQMTAALAHDLNNVLTAIGQSAYILETGKQSENERRSYIDVIQNAVHRGAEIIGRVREYLRTGTCVLQPVDVRQLLQEALEMTRPLYERANIELRSDLRDIPHPLANPGDLRRVFTNVIMNAIEAMPQGGRMVVTCDRAGDQVLVTVSDTGPGIAPENRRKIFYPYFTTKKAGTGLGLSGAKKTLRSQGGNIEFRTAIGKGTTFVITLPAARKGSVNKSASQPQQTPAA